MRQVAIEPRRPSCRVRSVGRSVESLATVTTLFLLKRLSPFRFGAAAALSSAPKRAKAPRSLAPSLPLWPAAAGPANGISLHRGHRGRGRSVCLGVSDHEFVRLKIAALNWMNNNGHNEGTRQRSNETNRYTDKGATAYVQGSAKRWALQVA